MFLLTTSCFSGEGCDIDLDACEKDADCGGDAICEPAFLGNVCVSAFECQTDDDCLPGERCVQRPPSEPQHPFATDLEGKKVCECSGDDCVTSVTTSTSTTGGGMGGSGGSGGFGGFGGSGGSSGIGGSGGAGGGALGGGGAGGMGGGA